MKTAQFFKASSDEINRHIENHRQIICDSQDNIKGLQNILDDRERMRKHRAKLNSIADLYINKFGFEITDNLINVIKAHFRCSTPSARHTADIVKKRVKDHNLRKKYAQIVLLSDHMTDAELGAKFKLSRQRINQIIREHKGDYF